ncbi:MAG: M56 family metallopeptidase [Clostridia bacterium]|nr:M56 family metallopeptidase [Clostridia bacterium]
MCELFETVLILSMFGFGITAVLLLLKPITAKKFPAKWQYYVWIAVLLSMIIPTYKLIPAREVQKIQYMTQTKTPVNEAEITEEAQQNPVAPDITEREIRVMPDVKIKVFDLLAIIWLVGTAVFLLTVALSYITYILKRRKNAVSMEDNLVLSEVKKELKIRRNIRVRMSPDVGSPMLVGVLFPVVYMPCKEIPQDMMRLVFLHELTHYKRKDLIIKWFALFVNSVHWFNPLSYILCANLSEACEVSCDMEVTKNMNDEEQKLYMKTILELVE